MFIIALGLNIIGMLIFHGTMPTAGHTQSNFVESLKRWREWAPQCVPFYIATFINMIVLSATVPTVLYIFNGKNVPITSPSSTHPVLNHDFYFAIQNALQCVGDLIARKMIYSRMFQYFQAPQRRCVIYSSLIAWAVGAVLAFTKIGWATPIGMMLVFFGTGLIYAGGARHVEESVEANFGLIALSMWLFSGDVAGIIGANLVDYTRELACGSGNSSYTYVCLDRN